MKKSILWAAAAAFVICGCNNDDSVFSEQLLDESGIGTEETVSEDDLDVKENESQFEEELEITGSGSVIRKASTSSSAYSALKNAGYNYEVPDKVHSTAHIETVYDDILKKNVYKFKIHAQQDNDPATTKKDRQRCEAKTDANSPAKYRGKSGETMTFKWKFKLPSDMKTTTKFCHVHQLKGLDNSSGTADVSMPLITFSAVTVSGSQKFQVKYHNRNNNSTTNWMSTDLSKFKGKWVTVVETCKFGGSGTYKLTIKDYKSGSTLVSISKSGVDMWRSGTAGMRPKWGVYRSIGDNGSLRSSLKDEYPRFADFSIAKN